MAGDKVGKKHPIPRCSAPDRNDAISKRWWFMTSDLALDDVSTSVQDPLCLDNQLCFSLYAAAHAIKKAYRPLLENLGLTYPQYLILIVLWKTDGLKVSDIGRRLSLDSGTLTPVLKRLEVSGLVKRTRRPQDEREVEIGLTPAGHALRDKALDVRRNIVHQLAMSEEEIAALRTDLNALIATLATDAVA